MTPAAARLRAALCAALLLAPLGAEVLEGRVTDGRGPLAGVRVHPDRPRRIRPLPVPEATTGPDGAFRLEVDPGDAVLVLEKDGWRRDLAPRSEWSRTFTLRPAPEFSRERVLVVRVELPGAPSRVTDDEVRALCFGREPGRASAAAHLLEASKGGLLLEEGAVRRVSLPDWKGPADEARREALARRVLAALEGLDLGPLDRVDNRTGEPVPDGRPDHLWILAPGPPGAVTLVPEHLRGGCLLLEPRPGRPVWPVVLLSEEAPLGTLVHEALHAMGEHRADDLYRGCDEPLTAGVWDLMDAGQYRGWDEVAPARGPWREVLGASPSHPGPWTRSELWYRGRYRDTVATRTVRARSWTGWVAPVVRAPGTDPQRLVLPDPAVRGRRWELWVARPWGFEAGRIGGRTGPGHEGLLVARVEPGRLGRSGPGPVHLVDARPGTPEPPPPRLPCGRHDLDDAAFGLGPGGVARGRAGALAWEVLEEDAAGRMKVAVRWTGGGRR